MKKYIQRLIVISCISIVLIGAFMLGMGIYLLHELPIDAFLCDTYRTEKPTIILDDAGNELMRFSVDHRAPIALTILPPHVTQAFLAAEDWHFFTHHGISLRGIIRSACVNLYHRRLVQGASTITQQLIKLFFLDGQKKFSRKIKEQIYALIIELKCSKEQILEAYINNIYFGCGIYGIEAASQRFWAKSAHELSIAQAATLAGIVRCPGKFCPLRAPDAAQRRRNIVLGQMRKLHYITADMYTDACAQPLDVCAVTDHIMPHVREMIRQCIEEQYGKHILYSGGLTVQTTINGAAQQAAMEAFAQKIPEIRASLNRLVDGALLCIDHTNGQVKALVGGFDFATSQFNRALQARKQIGSTIKPLIYAHAFAAGYCATDVYVDEPLALRDGTKTWTPHNYDHTFTGPMTLARAFMCSNNIIAIKLLLEVGAQHIAQLLERTGFSGTIHTYPALALGCVDGTLWEVVSLMSIFPNHGWLEKPYYIQWIKDSWGNKIYKHVPQRHPIIARRTADQIGSLLELCAARSKRINQGKWITQPTMSKTGTTNDSRVCWFIGATPQFTTGVYIGCDDNRSMGSDIYPVRTAVPIWLAFHEKLPPASAASFTYDNALMPITIDGITGQPCTATNPEALRVMVPRQCTSL